MATPKLALIPASQGTSLYSVLPSNGVGDFNFTRGTVATRINSQGLIETVASGVSRLNYPLIDGVVNGCPSHLLETSRTNFITYSNGFTDSSWLATDATVVSGVISPDGTTNAFTFSNTASNGIIQKAVSITGTRVLSIFAKKGTHRYLRMGAYGGTSSYANFDLENGEVSNGANANIEYYGNGWYRCTCHSISGTSGGVQIFPSNNSVGAATTNGSIQIYGVHLQQASTGENSPTSYIPTTTAAVTRSAETANGSGDASTFNDSEGVLFAEISALANDGTFRYLSLSDGSNSNNVRIFFTSTLNQISFEVNSGASSKFTYTNSDTNILLNNKVAIKYKQNDFNVFINGIKLNSSTGLNGGNIPIGLDRLNFDRGTGDTHFYNSTKQIQYYDSALNDSDLETLTSWVSFTDMANGQQYSIK